MVLFFVGKYIYMKNIIKMDSYRLEDNRPILVQFDNGILTNNARKSIQFKYLRSKIAKSNKRMLAADTGSLCYAGNVLQKQLSPVTYYLGVIDKKSNKIENIARCNVCTMKPKLKEVEDDQEKIDNEKSFREKTDSLIEAFGSAKQKRLLSSRKKNMDVQDTISDKVAAVTKDISTPDIKKESNESVPLDAVNIIPPKNKNARARQDIFDINDIISFQDYQLILGHAQQFINCSDETLLQWKTDQTYPEYIIQHLTSLPLNQKEREKRACYLVYLSFLMELFMLSYSQIRNKDPCPSIPDPIKSALLNKYTYSMQGRNRCVPKKYKDKQLCYILVLSLLIDEFELNCNLLLKDLKLSASRMTNLLRVIGCTVKTSQLKANADDVDSIATPTVVAILNAPKDVEKSDKASEDIGTPAKKKKKEQKHPKSNSDVGTTPVKKIKKEQKHLITQSKSDVKTVSVNKIKKEQKLPNIQPKNELESTHVNKIKKEHKHAHTQRKSDVGTTHGKKIKKEHKHADEMSPIKKFKQEPQVFDSVLKNMKTEPQAFPEEKTRAMKKITIKKEE